MGHPITDHDAPERAGRKPLRLLVVMPSWIGDAIMATPALRTLRSGLPGAFIGALVRPGLDDLLAGSNFFDELHVDRARGVMGPKLVASRIRPRRYDTALLLTNSFSTALITRLAFIPRRVGYDRDGRGLLLTDRLKPDRKGRFGPFVPISAVEYYTRAALEIVNGGPGASPGSQATVRATPLELSTTPAQDAAGAELLRKAGLTPGQKYAIINPGANDPAKRWPADRFAAVAAHLVSHHALKVLVNGSPAESDLCDQVVRSSAAPPGSVISLPPLGVTIGSLKAIVRGAALMVTNDTGPRHIAAAFRVPLVNLYGPTDLRWTVLPDTGTPSIDIAADPALPPDASADEHPDRCRIDRIETARVIQAADHALASARTRV